MAECKIKRENYLVIQGFMITDLKLKGNELLVYACIYGFSQSKGQIFSGTVQYLADWTNSTKRSIYKVLKSLEEKGYIKKYEKYINNVKFCDYSIVDLDIIKGEKEDENEANEGIEQSLQVVNKVHKGSEQNSQGVVNKVRKGSEQSSANNNIIDKTTYKKEERKKETNKERMQENTQECVCFGDDLENQKSTSIVNSTKKDYASIIDEMVTDSEIKELLWEFIKMRRMKKKPLTDFAIKKQINKLNRITTNIDRQKEIIEKTIVRTWDEFYDFEGTDKEKVEKAGKYNDLDLGIEL